MTLIETLMAFSIFISIIVLFLSCYNNAINHHYQINQDYTNYLKQQQEKEVELWQTSGLNESVNEVFTLIEVLFSLSICLLIIFKQCPILRIVTAKDKLSFNLSSYALGVKQISSILHTAKDIEINDDLTYTNANNEIFTISLNHHRIVKEPGFDIIIHNVDELNFYQKNKNIYMKIIVDNKEHVYLIATDYQISENEKDEVETVL